MVKNYFFIFERMREKIMSETKVRYQRGYVNRLNKDKTDKARGSLEVWVNGDPVKETAANGKTYLTMMCSGTYAKSSGLPYALEVEPGIAFVRVVVFDPLINYVEKLNLGKGSRIQVYGNFEKKTYKKKDGSDGCTIECIAQKVEKKWPLDEGKFETFGGYVTREVSDTVGKAVGSLAMYLTKPIEVKKTGAANEVGEVSLNGRFQSNSGIPYALGDDILDPKDGHMFMTASAWSYALDSFKRLNLQKGALIQVYGTFEVQEFKRNDGTVGKSVVCKDIKKFDVLAFGKADGDAAAPAAAATVAAAPAAPADAAPENNGDEFQAPASFGDIVVPF